MRSLRPGTTICQYPLHRWNSIRRFITRQIARYRLDRLDAVAKLEARAC